MKRLVGSCCCDVLMKLLFDLKISQEAQTHPPTRAWNSDPAARLRACAAVGMGPRYDARSGGRRSGDSREKVADYQKSIFSRTFWSHFPL